MQTSLVRHASPNGGSLSRTPTTPPVWSRRRHGQRRATQRPTGPRALAKAVPRLITAEEGRRTDSGGGGGGGWSGCGLSVVSVLGGVAGRRAIGLPPPLSLALQGHPMRRLLISPPCPCLEL